MFKSLMLIVGLTSLLSPMNRSAVETNAVSNVRAMIPSWENSSISFAYSFSKDDVVYQLYSVSTKGKNEGYAVLKDDKVVLAHEGNDFPSVSEMETCPLISSTNHNYTDSISLQASSSKFASYSYICNPTSLVFSSTSSQAVSSYLKDVPEYFNEGNNCAPTTAAMLFSFYDRYSKFTTLYDGLLPLNHDDDKTAVDAFIDTMKVYLKTIEIGSYPQEIQIGLKEYFDRHCSHNFKLTYSKNYADYIDYYNYSKNPAFIILKGHAVLGIGHASIRQYHSDGSQGIGEFMITHYDWRSRSGNYLVAKEEFSQFYYFYK